MKQTGAQRLKTQLHRLHCARKVYSVHKGTSRCFRSRCEDDPRAGGPAHVTARAVNRKARAR